MKLRILMNNASPPVAVHVIERSAKRDAMWAVAEAGDVIEWSSNKDGLLYKIRFVDQNGNDAASPFSDWSGSWKDSVSGVVTGTIKESLPDVVYKYNVETQGGSLDPQIIIDN